MAFGMNIAINNTQAAILEEGINLALKQLRLFQDAPTYSEQLRPIFGNAWSESLLDELLNSIQAGQGPQFEVLEDSQIGALGAYSSTTNKIYLSQQLLEQAAQDSSLLVSVVLEELGHYFDAKLNATDSAGDEGQLFALLVQQGFLSQSQLTALQNQADQGEITVEGQTVAVEFARDSYGTIDNIGAFGLGSLFVGDLRSGVNGDGSVTITGSALQAALPQNITGLSGNTGSSLTRAFATPYQGLSRRLFTKNADGSFSTANSADKSTLRLVVDHYELTEEDGTVVVLRADGRLNYLQNRNGFRITANYNAVSGQLTSLVSSDGENLTFRYNAQGRIDKITDRANQETTFTYSANGQLLTGVNDPTYQVSYSYESPYSQTLVTKASYANGPTFVFDYDANGRIQQQSLLNGDAKVTYRYSLDGKSYSVVDGTGATTTVTQTADGGFTQTNPLGKSISGSYDAVTRTWTYTAPNSATSKETYSTDGRLTETTNALNQKVAFTYDPTFGQLAGFTDAKGNGIDYAYDTKGNLNKITYEDGSFEQYAYNQTTGLLTQSTNRRGQSINLQYNGSYQLTQTQYSNNTTETYGYDAATGQLTSITNASGTTSLQFNPTTRQSKITYSNGRSLSYTFDTLGRRTQLVVQDNLSSRTTNYTYDFAGRLDKLTDGANQLIVDYDYDAVTGRLQKETNGNGTYTTYEYDGAGQITKLGNYAPSGAVTSQFEYTYNDLGQRTQVKSLDGTWTYGYDATGQLTRGVFTSTNAAIANQDLTYEYDAAGNRVRTIVNGVTDTVTTNNLNQYTQSGNTAYRYDADGNLIEKQTGSQLWKYSYDDQSRLIKVVDATNNITQYEYDVFGNRSATIYNGTRTEYLVDPSGIGDVVGEYDGSGGLVASYTHGLGLVSRNANGASAYYDFDAIGSTAGLTGNSGAVLNRYSYRPFGEDFYEVETVSNSFEYVGQFGVTEEQNGLDYMRARFYDPNMGRFSSIDPIGFQGKDTNFYRYASNSPTLYIDPQGTFLLPIFGAVAVGLGLATFYVAGVREGERAAEKYGAYPVQKNAGGLVLAGTVASAFAPWGLVPGLPAIAFGSGLAIGAGKPNNAPSNTPATPQPVPSLPNPFVPGNPQFPGELPQRNPAGPGIQFPISWLPAYLLPLKRGFPASGQLASPLVLDLDNDGIELTNLNTSQTYFDIDGDGFREATGWVKADDGLLVRDVNNDSFINDNTELFGNNTAAQINSGFTKLKTLDTNADGWISATDTAFNSLKIWRDLDQDGISDTGELFTLNQLNISRISVNPTATNQTIEGNQILETAQYELTNGTQRTIVDAWFALDDMNSRYDFRSTQNAPVVITNEILSLPNLKGYGTLPDLHIAMAKDPQLLTLVKDFTLKLNQQDLTSAKAMVQSILLRWAGVDSIVSNSRGAYIDARKLTFLEKFIGRPWVPSWATDLSIGANPLSAQGQVLNQLYDQSESSLTGRLLIQHSVFNSAVSFDATTDRVTYLGTYESAIEQLDKISAQFVANPSPLLELQQIELSTLLLDQQGYSLIQVGTGASDQIQPWFTSIYAFPFTSNVDTAVYGLAGNDTITTNSGNDVLYGGSGDDVLNGGGGNDLLLGGSGNDTLIGDGNQDTLNGGLGNDFLQGGGEDDLYQYDKGQGNDVLLDASFYYSTPLNGGNDTLEFGKNIGRNDLTWLFDGRNLTFSIVGSTTDKISIQDYIDPNRTIEKITIAGTPLSLTEIMTAYEGQDINGLDTLSWQLSSIKFNGLGGNDNIMASPYNDILLGGDGNDNINGQGGDDFIDGGNGDDYLDGTSGKNTIYGGLGNDTLLSGYENDSLFGGDGNDLLVSSWGDDFLDGGFGNDTLQGGYGDDTYLFSKGQGNKTIWDVSDYADNDTLLFGSNVSRSDLTWFFDGKDLTFSVAGATTEKIVIQDFVDRNRIIENITIAGTQLSRTEIMTAYEGQDINGLNTLSWQSSSIKFNGLAGNDNIMASPYNDTLFGGDGNDIINGQGGDDFIDGGNGDDYLDGTNGNNTIYGGLGNDTLIGYGNNDTLFGGDGNDLLVSNEGDDLLDGGFGNDTLQGGYGDDTYLFSKGQGNKTIWDAYVYPTYAGNDTLVFGSNVSRSDLTWFFDGKDLTFSVAGATTEKIIVQDFVDPNRTIEKVTIAGTPLSLTEIMTAYEGQDINGVNTLSWQLSSIKFNGLAGNDNIMASPYNDTLLGGDGNDIINGQGGDDFIDGGNGDDYLDGTSGKNTIYGGLGNDSLLGGYDNDSFFGGDGNDILISNEGNDLLDGGFGNDTLQGGYGDDTYLFSKGQGNKTILDAYIYPTYAGNDTLVFGSNVSRGDLTWFFDGKDLTFSIAGATTEKVIIQDFVDINRRIENITIAGTPLSLAEIMTAYEGQDMNGLNALNWQSSSIKFNGLSGNDNIMASPYNDTLLGGDGNDTINGQGGDDFINGGNGDDYLDGTSGNDTLDGGIGNDILVGGTGNDSYFVDSTSDVINEISTTATEIDSVNATISYTLGANLENLTLGGTLSINGTGNILDNLIIGNSGVNNLIGSSGNDTIDGAAGNDILSGDDGNDSLIGGSGNDSLSGGTGNDILNGGIGTDTLVGGTGNDSYFVDNTGDVVTETSTIVTEIDSVTATITYTLGANLENLTLGGSSAINGTGNTLNNQLIGNTANNSLYGLAGDDSLDGGNGNDALNGDDGNDTLIGGLGIDTLLGGLGDDILVGGAGNDALTGGGGSDRFLFDINATFSASTIGVDRITDFLTNTDKIVLDKTTFTLLRSAAGSGFSTAADFASVADNAAAAISSAYITYSRATGSLFYNQNGSATGLGTGGEFANLSGLPTLTAADFTIQT